MATMRTTYTITLLLAGALGVAVISGCGGGSQDADPAASNNSSTEASLSQDQIEKGIGPITNVTLGEIDLEMAAEGEAIFTSKCAACHKMDTRYVGPPLADVTLVRTPEFIMNMMLNPDQMIKEHPVGQELFATYMTPMPNQNMIEVDARKVLEYLRTVAPESN